MPEMVAVTLECSRCTVVQEIGDPHGVCIPCGGIDCPSRPGHGQPGRHFADHTTGPTVPDLLVASGVPDAVRGWEAAWPASHAMARARRDHPLELWQGFDRRPHGPDYVTLRAAFVPGEDGVLRERRPAR